MKKLIIILIPIFITFVSAYTQTLNNISSNVNIISKDTTNSHFSFRLKPVYISVQNSKNTSYYENGFGFTFSLQYDLGKVSLFFDVNTSQIKYIEKVKEHYPPVYIDKGFRTSNIILIGAKLYAPHLPAYLKASVGFLAENPIPPVLDFGIGYEYKLSKTFNLFLEGEGVYYGGIMEAPARTFLSVGIGTSIYIGNLYNKW